MSGVVDREKLLLIESRRGVDDDVVTHAIREQTATLPGKHVLTEHDLAAIASRTGVSESPLVPGRQTRAGLLDDAPAVAERSTPVEVEVDLGPTAFDRLRSKCLSDVLARLSTMDGGHALIQATLSEARRATRPVRPSLTTRPSPPDPAGRAIWGATERRAVTIYRRAMDDESLPRDSTADEALRRIGTGRALPEGVRRAMERELGVPLERVRVHADSTAAAAARAIRAEAFTIGEDIFFADGAFAPETEHGAKLLTHELAHVVQAWQGRAETGSGGVRVSEPGDPLEREADAVAERVHLARAALSLLRHMPGGAPTQSALEKLNDVTAGHASRLLANPPARDEAPAHLRPMDAGAVAPPRRSFAKSGGPSFVSRDLATHGASDIGDVEPELVNLGDGGEPLPPAIAARMRELLHHDFTHVRLHTDAAAARAATALSARAFTLGNHIYFNRDQFTPNTSSGERLLVHELTHVVQHDEGRLPHADGRFKVSDPGSATEREARAAEDRAGRPSPKEPIRGPVPAPPARTTATGPAVAEIQRAPDEPSQTPEARVAFVREEGLNLRAGPDQKAASLMKMKFGQRLHVLEDAKGEWQKVAVRGQTGYVHKPRIHFPSKELIEKDPGLTLIKVKSGQTFWGLVKEVYGIQGNEGSSDQNIDHFINAIRAVNKPEAFKVQTGVLDDIGNAVVPGRDASDTKLIAGVDLWIPSFGVAAKMDVGSGTVTGEVARYAKKFEQKLEDFGAACRASGKHIPAAIGRNAGEMAMGMLHGLIDFALDAAKILAGSTAVGALLGSFFGGVGAVPGAEIGFEVGLWILEYYGLYMLAEAVLGVAGKLLSQLGQFIALAWDANGDKAKIEKAGEALAEALGIFVSALLVVVAAYLLKRGANALSKTKFAQKVGQTRLARWLEERQNKTTTKDPLGKEKAAKEKLEKEKLEKEKADKEKADKEKADKEKADKEKAEKEKADKEKADKEKADKEKADKEKADREKADKEKADKEKADKEKADKEKADKEKTGKETPEKETPEKETSEKETPEKETPEKETSEKETSTSEKETSEKKTPEKETPEKEAPEKEAPEKEASEKDSATNQATKDHVHDGDTEVSPQSPYNGKWNGKGIHDWEGLQKRCAKDGYRITDVQIDPNTGVRRVTIERIGKDPRTGAEVKGNIKKTIYPKTMTPAEIDAAGESALKSAANKEANTKFDRPGEKTDASGTVQANLKKDGTAADGYFEASVPGPDGSPIRIQGWFKELPDGTRQITSHAPTFKNDWPTLPPENW